MTEPLVAVPLSAVPDRILLELIYTSQIEIISRLNTLEGLSMSEQDQIAQVNDYLSQINDNTTRTADAVDALQAYVDAHPDVDQELAQLVSDAAQSAQATSALADDATSTFAPAPPADGGGEPTPEPQPEPTPEQPPEG